MYALLVFLPILSNGLLLVLDVFSFIFFYPVGSFYKTFLLDVDTLRLFSIFGFQGTDSFLWMFPSSGDGEIRTLDPLLARQVLSQLSYAPISDGPLSGYGTSLVQACIPGLFSASGLKWTRTTDLTLIRRAL